MLTRFISTVMFTSDSDIALNIDILGVFTEKAYSKSLECSVVYFPISTFLMYLLKKSSLKEIISQTD